MMDMSAAAGRVIGGALRASMIGWCHDSALVAGLYGAVVWLPGGVNHSGYSRLRCPGDFHRTLSISPLILFRPWASDPPIALRHTSRPAAR